MSDIPKIYPNREAAGADGTVRKAHYGPGKQPWDTTLEFGWGPHAAGFCVLRYLRRDKAVEHSRESARWYYNQLVSRANEEAIRPPYGECPWLFALKQLDGELIPEEKELLL